MIRVKKFFSNSIYLEFMGKKDKSDALLLSAVFWNSLTRWLQNGGLKQHFLDVSVASFLGNNNFQNIYARTLVFFFQNVLNFMHI